MRLDQLFDALANGTAFDNYWCRLCGWAVAAVVWPVVVIEIWERTSRM